MSDPKVTATTARFEQKREAIIAAATGILNSEGVKGMTLADVGHKVGLSTTSVTYYFRKKEDLAATCLHRGIATFRSVVEAASHWETPTERVRAYIRLYLDLDRRIRSGQSPPVAYLSEIRALREPQMSEAAAAFADLFRGVRRLFGESILGSLTTDERRARTLLLMEQAFWSSTWLHEYGPQDYSRVADRMHDILINGLAASPGQPWTDQTMTCPSPTDREDLKEDRDIFLIAATRLINQRGYRGSSVEDISAELNVTKGSFYHHNETKEQLAARCFQRSFAVLSATQNQALRLPADEWLRLTTTIDALVQFQLSERGPLIRASALWALPIDVREQLVLESQRIVRRFAGMISDGIAQGSIRPVDPMIAAQMLTSLLNAAASLGTWVPALSQAEVGQAFVRPFFYGLLRT